MIALDTNVLVRYAAEDDPMQSELARRFVKSLDSERPGYVCSEVLVELVWVLQRSYRFSRDRIATVLEDLSESAGIVLEAADDVDRATRQHREGGDFADRMIVAAAKRAGALPVYTFDKKALRLEGATPLAPAGGSSLVHQRLPEEA